MKVDDVLRYGTILTDDQLYDRCDEMAAWVRKGNYIVNSCYSEGTFLLTMSTNNTKTTDDDEIVVIWKSMDMEGEIK